MGDRRQEPWIEPGEASELLGVAAIVIAVALVDGLQLARVGDDALVVEFG
jgi:hypothetical protein